MALEFLSEPVSGDNPAGPNLDQTDDAYFVDYYFDAVGRLPENYYVPGMQRPDGGAFPPRIFDPKSVDFRAEAEQIDPLLKRSRDIRLVVLRCQWALLAGRLAPAVESVEGVAAMIEALGDDVHPNLDDGPADRRDALNDLAAIPTVQQPLEYLGLAGPGQGTLRKWKAASGTSRARDSEEAESTVEAVSGWLTDAGATGTITENLRLLTRYRQALVRIRELCASRFVLDLSGVEKTLEEMVDFVIRNRPDLAAEAPAPVATQKAQEPEDDDIGDAPGEIGEAALPGPGAIVAMPALDIESHGAARAALTAVETYFARYEPSSAALLLVSQAKALIGMPLMQALEVLLPQKAGEAVVTFPGAGFTIPSARLKQLSETAKSANAAAEPDPVAAEITSAGEAAGAIKGVEAFFRYKERSSPVPLLLERARGYMEKDFRGLLAELLPAAPAASPQQAGN